VNYRARNRPKKVWGLLRNVRLIGMFFDTENVAKLFRLFVDNEATNAISLRLQSSHFQGGKHAILYHIRGNQKTHEAINEEETGQSKLETMLSNARMFIANSELASS